MRTGLALMTLAACAQAPAPTQETGDTYVPWVNPCVAIQAGANRTSCTSGIKGTPSPANGATDMALSPTFAMQFITDEQRNACFELTSDHGAPALIPPNFTDDGRGVWFGPTAPLQPDSDYVLTVHYSCQKTAPIAFHTASAGVDMSDADLAGRAYQLELGSGAWVGQNGDPTYLVRTLFRTGAPLVLVPQPPTDGRPTWSALAGALDESGAQAACAPTPTVDLRQSLGALRTVRLFDLDLPTSGGARMVHTSFYGELVSDGSAVVGVQLEGFFDLRDIAVNDDHTVGAACALLEGFDGLSCGPCPADVRGGGDYCVPFHLVNGVAPSVETTITPKDQASIEADPACTPPA